MKPNVMLMIASLLSIILMIFHMTDDIVRGMEPGTLFDLIIVPILAVWLYGTLVLRERRPGYIIVLVASLLGLLVPIIHMNNRRAGSRKRGTSARSPFVGCWRNMASSGSLRSRAFSTKFLEKAK